MTAPAGTPHASDDELFQLLLGEPAEEAHAPVRAHLRGCRACGRRAESIRLRSEALDARLAELDWAPPRDLLPASFEEVRRGRGTRLRPRPAAAVALRRAAMFAGVLLASALLALPLRAWVAEWAGARWSEVAAMLGAGPAPQVPAPAAPAQPRPTEYRFAPEGSRLSLEIASPQAEGILVVRVTGEVDAALQVVQPGTERAPVLVLPDRVVIRNSPSATGSYLLTLPGTVSSLFVRIGSAPGAELRTAELRPGQERSFPLRGRR